MQIALNQTPFYAESGGQVGDTGLIRTDTGTAEVTDTRKTAGVFVHIAKVIDGEVAQGQAAMLIVDHARRTAIRANHSATHLLHEALREALGDHVAQRGSLNAADRLRFDFSHNAALSAEELAKVEEDVNAYIRQNAPVETRIMTPDDARALGAQALFGEKYGDEVRVVSMGRQDGSGKGSDGQTYSLELCGGTHVRQTGDIGVFVLLGDSASSAGVRRIEALTGADAIAPPERAGSSDQRAGAGIEGAGRRRARAGAGADGRTQGTGQRGCATAPRTGDGGRWRCRTAVESHEINGIQFIAQVLSGVTGKDLPALIDEHKSRLGSGAVLLIADAGGKAAVAAGVTDDMTARVSAVDLVKAAVAELGGKGGGGRPDMAQGGGPDAAKAKAAIAAATAVLEG